MYKVLIRPLEIKDASISFQWRNDEEVWKYTGSKRNIETTEEIERKWLSDKLLESNSKRFAIEVDNIYVGNIQLTSITENDAEFHIFIGNKNYWGKGIGFSAIQQILRFADYHLKIDVVYLIVNPCHERAIKLYKKCGFSKVNDLIRMEINLKDRMLPMVSIYSTVYNHERFLETCLDSFLMQKCLFDFEIVVGEDCSSDRSREILLDYHKKFPGKFKLLLHDQNVGAIQNQNLTLNACDGKYIALCEGDDYWTDPYKLQKQVDFLEANPDFVLCFHPVKILEPDGSIVEDYITKVPKNYETVETMAEKGNYIHTPSVVFRNVIKTLPDEMSQSPVGDYFLYMLLGEYGKYGIINQSMSVYRNGIGNFSVLHQLIKQVRWNTTLFLISRCLKDEVIIDIIQEKYVTSSQSLETGINNLLKKKPMVIRSMINRLKSKLLNV